MGSDMTGSEHRINVTVFLKITQTALWQGSLRQDRFGYRALGDQWGKMSVQSKQERMCHNVDDTNESGKEKGLFKKEWSNAICSNIGRPRGVILSKVSQTEKVKYRMTPLIYGV